MDLSCGIPATARGGGSVARQPPAPRRSSQRRAASSQFICSTGRALCHPCTPKQGPRLCRSASDHHKTRGLQCAATSTSGVGTETAVVHLEQSLRESESIPPQKASAAATAGSLKFRTTQEVKEGQVIMEIPSGMAVTAYDVKQHPLVGSVAETRSELVGLALWLMAERANGSSTYSAFLETLPETTLSPLLWTKEESSMILRGTTIEEEAPARAAALRAEWAEMQSTVLPPSEFPSDVFNEEAFMNAFAVVLGSTCYLPAASCFALLPLLGSMRRSGGGVGTLDYDSDRDAAVLLANQDLPAGTEVSIFDDRGNGEMLMSTGRVEPGNPCDYLTITAELVKTDGIYMAKKMVLDELGYTDPQVFPVYKDRMPIQLLAYIRLARIQDVAELAKLSFEQDTIISQLNEYESLQLLMGDCRDMLSGFQANVEDDTKELSNPELTEKERQGIQLRIEEQVIAQSTMDAVRRKLAPIRGIPTKSGMQDPNQDLIDMFDTLESIPNAPKNLVNGFMSWARGDYDPEFRKQKKK